MVFRTLGKIYGRIFFWTLLTTFIRQLFFVKKNLLDLWQASEYVCDNLAAIYEKLQYVGKSEYSLNLRISAHTNDVFRTNGLVCD